MYKTTGSPLEHMDVSFENYVRARKTSEAEHLIHGIPDYAFDLDYELKEKVFKIPHLSSFAKKATSSLAIQEIHKINQDSIAVGPNQYPEIYQMGVDCAKKLGIGVPNIYVYPQTSTMNAFTYACDDASPVIVIFSSLIERMTPGEIKAVIGHECGHIHNNHGVLQYVVNVLMYGIYGTFGAMFSQASLILMQQWSRACEITADRAAMICADTVEDARNANIKLLTGAMLTKDYAVNLDALREQLDLTAGNPSRYYQILASHPTGIRRIFAEKEFEECEIFYRWRPELKRADSHVRSREETDERCKKIVDIFQKG